MDEINPPATAPPPALPPRPKSTPTVVQASSVTVLKAPPPAEVHSAVLHTPTPPAPKEAKPTRPLRIFSGTYNARGRPERQEDGTLERIAPGALAPWVDAIVRPGEPLPDLFFFALEEVMDLNPLNVVLESTFTPSEDHHARVAAWRDGLLAAIYGAAAGWRTAQPPSTDASTTPPPPPPPTEYVFIGSSTQVGLALLVFGTAKTAAQLTNLQTANVKTGFGGLLGNKGSCVWRAELGLNGPSICAVASHFASGRDHVDHRNECYDLAVRAKLFPPLHGGDSSPSTSTTASDYLHPQNQDHGITLQKGSGHEPLGEHGSLASGGGVASDLRTSAGESHQTRGQRLMAGVAYLGAAAAHRLAAAGESVLFDDGELRAGGADPKKDFFGILDHDLVVWAGDLNYALHESVDGVECRADLESKRLGNAPSLQDEGLGSRFRSQWAAADQLSSVRAAGKAFVGFDEGPLQFRPTYRVMVGDDAYDPKRCPAWTDRVLWRDRAKHQPSWVQQQAALQQEQGGHKLNKKKTVECVAYSCSWACRLSDHKPVYVMLDVQVNRLKALELPKVAPAPARFHKQMSMDSPPPHVAPPPYSP